MPLPLPLPARYLESGPDRLWDTIESRYFITERLSVEKMNEALGRAIEIVSFKDDDWRASVRLIRALKEKV